VRYTSVELHDAAGAPAGIFSTGDTLVVRAGYRSTTHVERPVFQLAIVDVDTGVIVTTASSNRGGEGVDANGDGVVECRFTRMPLRPRQYILRLSITDAYQLASYDVVTAGPRFAVIGPGSGVDSLAEEQDGLVSLPFEFSYAQDAVAPGERR
jgi:hypothetical protein